MHKLEITGATPEEFYYNAMSILSLLLNGASSRPAAAPVEAQQPEPVNTAPTVNEINDLDVKSTSESTAPQVPAKGKRGPKAKNTEPSVDLPTEKTIELNDDISDLGGKPVETVELAKALTLNDDIKPRLQAIQKACVARNMDMPATVAYILKLYGPFGIQKADQLKPEQFAEFMEASEAYLSGEA